MNINPPITKLLLVLINQCLIYFTICNSIYNFFDRAQEANMYEIKSRSLRSQKVVGIEKVDISNLQDLVRLVLISEECRNLKVVIDGIEFTRNINH